MFRSMHSLDCCNSGLLLEIQFLARSLLSTYVVQIFSWKMILVIKVNVTVTWVNEIVFYRSEHIHFGEEIWTDTKISKGKGHGCLKWEVTASLSWNMVHFFNSKDLLIILSLNCRISQWEGKVPWGRKAIWKVLKKNWDSELKKKAILFLFYTVADDILLDI